MLAPPGCAATHTKIQHLELGGRQSLLQQLPAGRTPDQRQLGVSLVTETLTGTPVELGFTEVDLDTRWARDAKTAKPSEPTEEHTVEQGAT